MCLINPSEHPSKTEPKHVKNLKFLTKKIGIFSSWLIETNPGCQFSFNCQFYRLKTRTKCFLYVDCHLNSHHVKPRRLSNFTKEKKEKTNFL